MLLPHHSYLQNPGVRYLTILSLGFLLSETENWGYYCPAHIPFTTQSTHLPSAVSTDKGPLWLDYCPQSIVDTGASICLQRSLPVPIGYKRLVHCIKEFNFVVQFVLRAFQRPLSCFTFISCPVLLPSLPFSKDTFSVNPSTKRITLLGFLLSDNQSQNRVTQIL